MNAYQAVFGLGLRVIFSFVFAVFPFSTVFSAAEGSGTSGGGGVHVCLNSKDGSIQSIQLYDLYEGVELYEYKMIDPGSKSASELLAFAMTRIWQVNPALAGQVMEKLKIYSERMTLKKNKQFDKIDDASIIFLDQGCYYQQMARWEDSYKKVFVADQFFQALKQKPLHLAAFTLHEAVYAYFREHGEKNSDSTRKFVAQIFSNRSIELPGFLDSSFQDFREEVVLWLKQDRRYEFQIYSEKNDPFSLVTGSGYPSNLKLLPKQTGSSRLHQVEIKQEWGAVALFGIGPVEILNSKDTSLEFQFNITEDGHVIYRSKLLCVRKGGSLDCPMVQGVVHSLDDLNQSILEPIQKLKIQ